VELYLHSNICLHGSAKLIKHNYKNKLIKMVLLFILNLNRNDRIIKSGLLSFNYYMIRTVRVFFVELHKARAPLTINSGRLRALPGSGEP
jgi:hypothetical protein